MGRRCTCDRLFRQIDEDSRLRTLPMAAKLLWLSLMRLAATTPGCDGVLRFGFEFGFLTSVSLAVSCAETEVETALASLERRGLVERVEDGTALRLPDAASAAKRSETARINGSKGGAPRKGESLEAYRRRKQGNLLLPIVGDAQESQKTRTETPRARTTTTIHSIDSGEVGSSAGARSAATMLADELAGLVGMRQPARRRDVAEVASWLKAGVTADMVRSTVQACIDRPDCDTAKIFTLRYFAGAVMEAPEPRRAPQSRASMPAPSSTGYERAFRQWKENGAHGAPPSLAEWQAQQAQNAGGWSEMGAYQREVLRPWEENGRYGIPRSIADWRASREVAA